MAVTINGDGVVDVGGNASSAAYVRLYEDSDNGTNYVDLIAPASVTSNRTITLPDNTGTMLTSASSITASQLPAGSVLQVVQGTLTTSASTTSTSYTDTGLTVSITPTSASSKVMVFVHLNGCGNNNASYNGFAQLVRDSTAIGNTSDDLSMFWQGSTFRTGSFVINWLDSPATTSSTTYKVQFKSEGSGTTVFVSASGAGGGNVTSTITVMEIAG